MRRVRRKNPTSLGQEQGELFTMWRHHAVFVTSGFEMLQAEGQHRDHAIVEQVIADAAASALAHLPSGVFTANAAWTVLWAISHNLTRAAGTLAGAFHARATTATIRAHLINVPARIARSARRVTLHLPQTWPWQAAWKDLHTAVQRPPAPRPDHRPDGHDRRNRSGKAGQTGSPATPKIRCAPQIHDQPDRKRSRTARLGGSGLSEPTSGDRAGRR